MAHRIIHKDLRRAVGLAVRELRELRSDTQAVFARRAKFTRAYLQKLERGLIGVTIDMQYHLAKAFDMSFMNFMNQVDRRRTEFTDRAYDFESQILEDGIMIVNRVGWVSANKEVEFIKRVYTYAKKQSVYKVLFNLTAANCDFSKEEEWEIATTIVEWLKAQLYWPIVAVVRNVSLGGFGAKSAHRDGLNVQMFWDLGEAHEWLAKQPLPPSCPRPA